MKGVAGIVVLALIAAACGGGSDSAELEALREEVASLKTTTVPPTTTMAPTTTVPPTTTVAPTTTVPPTTTVGGCSLESEGRPLVQMWNSVTGELLASYQNESVSGEQYINTSDVLQPLMDEVVNKLYALETCLPADEWALLDPLLTTYVKKLLGFMALEQGVRTGSHDSQSVAWDDLIRAHDEAMAIVCDATPTNRQVWPMSEYC
jgi:hypothetical protein